MISYPVVNMAENWAHCRCRHHIFALVFSCQPLQVFVLTWRIIRLNTILVDLWVSRQPIQECVQLRIQLYNFASRINAWFFDDCVDVVLKCWDDVHTLPVILKWYNRISFNIYRFCKPLQINLEIELLIKHIATVCFFHALCISWEVLSLVFILYLVWLIRMFISWSVKWLRT